MAVAGLTVVVPRLTVAERGQATGLMLKDHNLKFAFAPSQSRVMLGSSTDSLIHLKIVAGLIPTSRAAPLSDGLIVNLFKISTCTSWRGRACFPGRPIG